jgi:hypothetical protein
MIELSNETIRRIIIHFHEKDREFVEKKLSLECGDNLPMIESGYTVLAERIRFAVLKLSKGNRKKLGSEINNAAKDWRDTLMATGFGYDEK